MNLSAWRLPTADELEANEHAQAIITCPDCKLERTLGAKHHVAPSGYVVPSVVCAPPCKFHEWVTLKDWCDHFYACTECVWIGNKDQLDDDSQDWEVCPACGANVHQTTRLAELENTASDKERIDWLEMMANKPAGILLHSEGNSTGRLGLGLAMPTRSLRDAIDQAMEFRD